VSEFGAETDQTILFTNEITGINVSSNVLVSGNVTANVYYGDGGLLANITQTLEGITAIGNTTPYTLEFNNTDTAFVTVSNVGIGNALPTADLCVGSNVVIDDASLDKISVTGNVNCHQLNLGSIEILPAYSLEQVTGIGNTATNTMSFNNSTLAFDTQKMAGIGIIPSSADVGVSGLHVDGHLRLGGEAENTDEEQMYIKSAGALGVLANESDTNNTNTELRLQSGETYNSNITMVGKSSAQYMTFGTNAAERMRIDSSGNVGIGLTNPQGLLHISSGTSGDAHLILEADTDNNNEFDNPKIVFRQDGGYYTGEIGLTHNQMAFRNKTGVLGGFLFFSNVSDGSKTDTDDLEDTQVEVMRIDGNGDVKLTGNLEVSSSNLFVDTTTSRVGVGTTIPVANLHVLGNVYVSSNLSVSGNVGINTSTTRNILHLNTSEPYVDGVSVQGGGDVQMIMGNHWGGVSSGTIQVFNQVTNEKPTTDSSKYTLELNPLGGTVLIGNTAPVKVTSSYVWFGANGSNLAVDTTTSRVGIGLTNPEAPLHIEKVTAFTGPPKGHATTEFIRLIGDRIVGQTYGISAGMKLGGDTGGTATADGRLEFYLNDGAALANDYGDIPDRMVMTLRGDGNVGIGTTNPATALDVYGQLSHSTTDSGSLSNYTVKTSSGKWYKIMSFYDPQSKCAFRIFGTVTGGTSPHSYSYIDVVCSVNNVSSDIHSKISQNDVYNPMSWTDFGIVVVLSTNYMNVYVKSNVNNLMLNLNICATTKNLGGQGAVFYTPESSYTLAFDGTMTTTIDTSLSGTLTQFDVYTNSNTKFYKWNTSGYVGIGTTNPLGLLHISSGTSGDCNLILEADTDNNNESDNPSIIFKQDGTLYEGMIGLDSVNNLHLKTAVGLGGAIKFSTINRDENTIGGLTSNAVERMTITNTGRVGIGTANPRTALEVKGPIMGTTFATLYSHNLYFDGGWKYAEADYGGSTIRMTDSEIQFWNAPNDNATGDSAATVTQRMTIDESGNVGIGVGSNITYKLNVNGQIFLGSPALAPAASNLLYDLDDDDAKILFYKNSYENWAGMGCDTGGSVWIKAGTQGQGGSVSLNSAGRFAVGHQNSSTLLGVHNVRLTPTLYYTFDYNTGIGSGSTLTLPGDVTNGTEMYTINPNWKKSSVCIITYDNANSTSSGLVYIYCHAKGVQPSFYLENSSTGSSQIIVDVGESRACHIKPVSGVTIRVTKCEWIGDDSRVIIKGHTPDITTADPSNNNYAQLEIQSAAAVLGTSTTNPVNLQLGAYHGGGGNVGCGFIQGICNFIYASPVCLQPRNGNVGIGTINPSYGSVDVWTGQRMSLLYDAFKNGTSTLQAGYSIDFRYGGNTGERGNIVARLQSYSWMNSSYVMRGGFGIEYGSGNGTTYTGFIINDVGDVGIGIGASTPYGRLEVADDDFYQLVLRNTSNVHYWRLGVENSASNTLIVYPANKSGGSSGGVFIRDGNTAWSGNSDERLKENIGIISNCLDKIKDVRPVTFNWKNTATPSQKQIGFIAQDWKDVVPEVVSTHATEDLEDCLTMQMVGTIPVVCGAVQELNAKVDEHIENKNLHVSDRRIKTNIVDVEDASALDSFRLLQPKRYEYVDKDKNGTDVVWGFLAQEVKEAVPYATTTKTGYLPNIQQYSNISGNVMTFTNFSTSNLESNALVLQVRDILGKFHDVHITEIIDETSVRIGDDLSLFTGSYDENGNVVTQTQTKTITTSEYNQLHNTFGYAPKEIVSYTSNVVVSYSSNTAVYYEPEQDKYYTEIEYSSLMTDIKSNVIVTYDITTITSDEYKLLGVEERAPYVNENWQERIIDLDEYDTLTDTQRNEMNLVPNIDYYVKTYTTYPGDLLYVYGQRVDDFVYLKKDAIWTLTTAALQEVDRQLQAEKAKVEDLLKRVEALESS
jgi:hypothetical protein